MSGNLSAVIHNILSEKNFERNLACVKRLSILMIENDLLYVQFYLWHGRDNKDFRCCTNNLALSECILSKKKKKRNKRLHLQYYIVAVIYKDQASPTRSYLVAFEFDNTFVDYILTLSVVGDFVFLNYNVRSFLKGRH